MQDPELNLPFDEQQTVEQDQPVTVLGMTFPNDTARREYFRKQLRAKLPELRKIEGFPIGKDDDIIALSDPPYYTACPNPWLNDFIAEWEQEKRQLVAEGKRDEDKVVTEPYASDVSEGKKNPIYVAHTYHTKVPHPAIMRFILHYTEPGDIVFDGFAGTGMTGVAANLCGSSSDVKALGEANTRVGLRHGICSDLSPIATIIAAAYNLKETSESFKRKANFILKKVEEECGWMYETKVGNKVCKVNYTVWSDILACPNCNNEFSLWEVAADDRNKTIRDEFVCPQCGAILTKKKANKSFETEYDDVLGESLSLLKKRPVKINYFLDGKQKEKDFDESDFAVFSRINAEHLPNVFPFRMPEGRESRRNDKNGILYAHQFYTKRALVYLSHVWNYVKNDPILVAWFTSTLMNASKMNRFRFQGYGLISGTLYVPSLFKEYNPLSLLKNKIGDFIEIFYKQRGNSIINVASATSLVQIKNDSIDYMFIDPPFGSNLMYSQLNSIWEWWLRVSTNNKEEAIVDENKTIFDYQTLMNRSLREFYRILKPGKWLTMEFSNTSASVWNSIQNALQGVGFIVANVSALDKQEGSFKAVTTPTAVKQDLIITCYKPSENISLSFEQSGRVENVWTFIDDYLQHLPVHLSQGNSTTTIVERSPKILYDRVITYYVQHGYPVPMDAQDFQAGLRERYLERDGMFFTAQQAAEYEQKRRTTTDFVPMGLLVGGEADGIAWLQRELETPQTYQELQPKWMQALTKQKKGDKQIEMMTLLEENFIQESDGKWRLPDPEEEADREKLRVKGLMREFAVYQETIKKPQAKIKTARLAALQEGFRQCYQKKDWETIIAIGNKIPEEMLQEDEVLLRFYDIAMRHK